MRFRVGQKVRVNDLDLPTGTTGTIVVVDSLHSFDNYLVELDNPHLGHEASGEYPSTHLWYANANKLELLGPVSSLANLIFARTDE